MDEDEWAEKVVRKHMRRSGIRRLYCYKDVNAKYGHLQLEFVIRGKVLGRMSLWRVASIFEDN